MSKDPIQEALDKLERAGISLGPKSGYEYGVEDGATQERERIDAELAELGAPSIRTLKEALVAGFMIVITKRGENK